MQVHADATVPELLEAYGQIFNNPAFRPSMHAVWDVARFKLTALPLEEFRKIPYGLRPYMKERGRGYKTALVTSRGVDFHLLKIYLTILKLVGNESEFRVFKTLEEAYTWVGEK